MSDIEKEGRIVRGMTPKDGFRLVAVDSTTTVRGALEAQQIEGDSARIFGELLTGVTLVRETMAPKLRVQAVLKSEQAGNMVGDSHPGGLTRGLASTRPDADFELGDATLLQIMRALPNGELHQGVVRTEPAYGLSASFTTYMHTSEQVESAVGVACVIEQGEVRAAGGYMLQKMPGAEFLDLAKMTAHLEHFESLEDALLEADADPETLLNSMLHDVDFDILERTTMRFGCNCSEQRFLSSLSTIGRDELQSLADEGEPLELECDYCASTYEISVPMLEAVLEQMRD
ncbi:MAG: Hsp33 family molecular chaperone HslO [Myxococcota bacterium]